MDMHQAPFPATKAQSVRSKYKNVNEAPRSKPKEPPNHRQKRVFGTIQNPNVPAKSNSLPEKVTKKQPIPRKQSKSVQTPEIKEIPVVEIPPVEVNQTTEIQPVQAPEIAVTQPESTHKTSEIQSVQAEETDVIQPESTHKTSEIQLVKAEETSVIQPESTQITSEIQLVKAEETSVIQPESTKIISEIQLVKAEETSVIRYESTHKTTEFPLVPVVEVSVIPSNESKSTQETEITPVPPKKSPIESRARTKKKSVCFSETTVRQNALKKLQEPETDGIPQTPVRSPFSLAKPRHSGTPFALAKPRLSGTPSSLAKARFSETPYQSAEKCSHCRFDRLETSSYWLSQIRLAESVGKHFVSLAFFGLALDSKAEPYRNLRVELKKYLGRHEYLSAETEWKDVSRKYGLLKDESNRANVTTGDGNEDIRDQEKQLKEEEEAGISQFH